jgi:hypothetical protein
MRHRDVRGAELFFIAGQLPVMELKSVAKLTISAGAS